MELGRELRKAQKFLIIQVFQLSFDVSTISYKFLSFQVFDMLPNLNEEKKNRFLVFEISG